MLKRLGFLAVAGLAVVLSGCAHSPQQLNVTPSVTIPLSQVARQQPVVLTVQDSRSSPVMGTRGGLYPDSSNLTISDQTVPHLRQQVEQALGKLGFQVVPEGTPNANSLVVSLAELSYESPKEGVYVTQADIGAAFSAEARSTNQRYNGRYSASAQHRFGYAPNQATNTRLVTEVMSGALSRIFKDPEIIRILQQ
ncbi:YajG family lipoprotein [Pseudomonas sp. FME51]|uniref:YajG family lipoprotein n=1 Tax=Pseudomonas sp. FME51 TaxID=2742609 RepID=UPI001866757D|nr:YajG family lipoprotein [Pseudomonas sp. FME51]